MSIATELVQSRSAEAERSACKSVPCYNNRIDHLCDRSHKQVTMGRVTPTATLRKSAF